MGVSLARIIVGLIFMMVGLWKVFVLGIGNHAQNFFVTPYADSWIPTWLLWASGAVIPVVELVAGFGLVVGLSVEASCYALGVVLVTVTYGHLLKEPLYDFTSHVMPRLALLLVVLLTPDEWDRLRLAWIFKRGSARANPDVD